MDIYVGNLPLDISEEEVKGLFETHGQVGSVKLIKDKDTGESRGFGFIDMPNAREAQNAIQALNGSDFKGNKLKINEARPRQPMGGGAPGGSGGGFQRRPQSGNQPRGGQGGFRGGRTGQSFSRSR